MSTDEKIDELARLVANGISEIRQELQDFREEVAQEFVAVRGELGDVKKDLNHFVITFRDDHDELTHRVKKLEEHVYD